MALIAFLTAPFAVCLRKGQVGGANSSFFPFTITHFYQCKEKKSIHAPYQIKQLLWKSDRLTEVTPPEGKVLSLRW